MVGAAVAASGDVANSAHPEQNPGVHQQKIVIRNNHGEKLVGLLHEAGSTEIVILGHGFQSTKIHFLDLISYLGSWFVQVYNFNFLYNQAATCFHRLYQWSLPIKRAQDMTVMALWTKATDNEAVQMSIGKTWKEFLDYNDVIGFKFHEDAKKLDRGAKTKYST